MPTYYHQLPIAFEYGNGAWLWDTTGKKFLDSLTGIAVCGLGHAHPALTATITEQANKLLHTSNTYRIPQQEKLAELLAEVSGMEQAYFCNSGAEANEAALKLTRVYARKKNIDNPVIITMKNSFHGRSIATLSASGNERIQQGFEPLLSGFIYANYNDLEELKMLAATHNNIVAVMLEPIQGDGGIQIADIHYLESIRSLCDENDWLMILDEVQTGIGRTGRWFCYQHTQIIPDVITVAKALGNGIPIAACLARGKANNLFGPGKHGTTFGGNPFVCACALTVLQTIKQENLIQNALEMGDFLLNSLKAALSKNKCVVAIRGKGLMLGVELDRCCIEMLAIGLKHGLLFNITADKVIRLLPPLILTKEEAIEIVKRLQDSIDEFQQTYCILE